MKTPKTAKPKIGQMVKTIRFVPGYPVGIPTDSFATVMATGSGRVQIESSAGTRLWTEWDAVVRL